MKALTVSLAVVLGFVVLPCGAAEIWEELLQVGIKKKHSETRHKSLEQVDTTSVKGLKALWSVLDGMGAKQPMRFDWYVRQGAYKAILKAEGDEAEAELLRVMRAKGLENSKESIVHALIWKIRQEFEKDFGENDPNKEAEAKNLMRKARGTKYFDLVLPTVARIDPEGQRFEWLKLAFADRSPRVRIAALQGFLAYPHNGSIDLLINNLKTLEKKYKKSNDGFREWVFTRNALETLTGQYFRDDVALWTRWWDAEKARFDLAKRVKEAREKAEDEGSRTRVADVGGVKVEVHMTVAGKPDGYPMLVLPWRGYDPEYFRPYFHGLEEFLRIYYIRMPRIEDFSGLKREVKSGLVVYPTSLLSDALAKIMKEELIGTTEGEGRGLKRFAVMGHGLGASTLAAKMAGKFKKEVSHLILMSPSYAGTEYSKALDSVLRYGRSNKNWEVEYGVKNIRITQSGEPEYKAADSAEKGGLSRALGNLRYADPTSPLIGSMEFFHQLPGGTNVLNDSAWSMKKIFPKKPRLPVMVVRGDRNPWSPLSDVTRVESVFNRPFKARFARSAEMPFMFETLGFTLQVKKFFRAAGVKTEEKKKKSKRSSRTKKK